MLKNLGSVLLAIYRTIITSAFWIASRIFHKVEVHGVEYDSGAPRTYIVCYIKGFLAYAERHKLIHRIGKGTWTPTFNEAAIQVRPREVGYDQSPLIYAWNELQEILSI